MICAPSTLNPYPEDRCHGRCFRWTKKAPHRTSNRTPPSRILRSGSLVSPGMFVQTSCLFKTGICVTVCPSGYLRGREGGKTEQWYSAGVDTVCTLLCAIRLLCLGHARRLRMTQYDGSIHQCARESDNLKLRSVGYRSAYPRMTGEISGDPNESIVQSFTSFRPYTHVESGPRHKTPKEPHVFIIRYLAKPAASPPLLRFVVNLS